MQLLYTQYLQIWTASYNWQYCRKKHSNIYLRQPSKKSAVLLLVFLSLGLIITCVHEKTRKSTGHEKVPNVKWANSLYAIGIWSLPLCGTKILHFPRVPLFEIYTPLNAITVNPLPKCHCSVCSCRQSKLEMSSLPLLTLTRLAHTQTL